MAKQYVIIPDANGNPERHLLKPWFRQHFQHLPAEFLQRGTSNQFKANLPQQEWVTKESEEIEYTIKRDNNGSISYAQSYIDDLAIQEREETPESEDAEAVAFGLEKDLQRALRMNIQQLEQGLQIVDGGRERHTTAGFIDITAQDTQGKIVVIELKATTAKPEVIAQTLAYMESVRIEDNTEVRGIIVANDFVERVVLAARQIPNLELRKYSFQFNFNGVE